MIRKFDMLRELKRRAHGKKTSLPARYIVQWAVPWVKAGLETGLQAERPALVEKIKNYFFIVPKTSRGAVSASGRSVF